MGRPASTKIDKTEEEPALGKLGKLSIIFLLVMFTELERDKHSGEQVERGIKKCQEP